MYAYFIDISQSSVETHLWRGKIYNNHIIANCLQSVPVKEFWKSVQKNFKNFENRSDKSKVARFLAHSVEWPHNNKRLQFKQRCYHVKETAC